MTITKNQFDNFARDVWQETKIDKEWFIDLLKYFLLIHLAIEIKEDK